MSKLGVDISGTEKAHFKKTKQRAKSVGPIAKRAKLTVSENNSFNRSTKLLSKPPRNEQGVKDVAMKKKLAKIAHRAISKKVKKMGLKGEADRFIGTKMPRHLFSGKRGIGKTDHR